MGPGRTPPAPWGGPGWTRPPGPIGPSEVLPRAPDADVDPPRLSVAAAARRLGIAPATLRTWDRRYGIGPSDHVPGRHRRYAPDDVARLELMQHALVRGASPAEAARYARTVRLPERTRWGWAHPPDQPRSSPPHPAGGRGDDLVAREVAADGGDGGPLLLVDDDAAGGAPSRVRVGGRVLRLPGAGRRARGLGRAALALDSVTVRRLLLESIAADGLSATWDEVARPVLAAVADRWAYTGAGVEIEHLMSECIVGVYHASAVAAEPAPTGRPVLLAGMPDELHILPMTVLAAVLAHRRVACRTLGADLPLDALVPAIRRTAPAVVVLWSQLPDTADADVIGALPRTRPRFRTFAAGPGWTGLELPPRVVLLSSLAEAAGLVADAVLA